jgi:type I restriction enzyme R subunit
MTMAKKDYSEDLLIQAPTAELLEKQLGWQTVFAQDDEDFGPDSLLGRSNDTEVVLSREVLAALKRLNPGLPQRPTARPWRRCCRTTSPRR